MDKSQKRILIGVAAVFVVLTIVFSSVMSSKNSYKPPEFDINAVEGVPELDEKANFNSVSLPISKGNCEIAICATPKATDDAIDVYFASSKKCDVWTSVMLYDSEGNLIGKSGVIKPGQYVKSVAIDKPQKRGAKIDAKVVTYEPETYYSVGTANLEISLR